MFRALIPLLLAGALTGPLAACGDKELVRLEAIRDEVCACKTPACGEAAMAKVPGKNVVSNHRTQRFARDMLDCLAKLYTLDRPSTDPDAVIPELPVTDAPGSAAPATP